MNPFALIAGVAVSVVGISVIPQSHWVEWGRSTLQCAFGFHPVSIAAIVSMVYLDKGLSGHGWNLK